MLQNGFGQCPPPLIRCAVDLQTCAGGGHLHLVPCLEDRGRMHLHSAREVSPPCNLAQQDLTSAASMLFVFNAVSYQVSFQPML